MKEATQMEATGPVRKSIAAYASPTLTAEEREQLILQHLPQVRLIARRIHDRLPESVSLDDLKAFKRVGALLLMASKPDLRNPAPGYTIY